MDDDWKPPTAEELAAMEERRREADRASGEIAKHLLKGWTLLDQVCPECPVPLMRAPRAKTMYCVQCQRNVVNEADLDAAGAAAAAACPPATTPAPAPALAPASSARKEAVQQKQAAVTNTPTAVVLSSSHGPGGRPAGSFPEPGSPTVEATPNEEAAMLEPVHLDAPDQTETVPMQLQDMEGAVPAAAQFPVPPPVAGQSQLMVAPSDPVGSVNAAIAGLYGALASSNGMLSKACVRGVGDAQEVVQFIRECADTIRILRSLHT